MSFVPLRVEFRDFEGSQAPTADPEVLGRESMELGLEPGRKSNEELRHTPNSTTTGSPHTDLVSTSNQPSHDIRLELGMMPSAPGKHSP